MINYKAFVSYSHNDILIAKAIQHHLSSFYTFLYPFRRLNVFLDENEILAGQKLTSSIERALVNSDNLIVLASKSSADSEWVSQEISKWKSMQNKPDPLLILIEGQIEWDKSEKDFNSKKTEGVNPALYRIYEEEPLWIDLREAQRMLEGNKRALVDSKLPFRHQLHRFPAQK